MRKAKRPAKRTNTTLALLSAAAGIVGLSRSAQADNFVMNASNAAFTSSFNAGTNWLGGAAPAAGNTYQTGAFRMRTPTDNNPYTFLGTSLELQAGFGMRNKNSNTITVNNLIMANGTHLELSQPNGQNGAGSVGTFAGNISLTSGTATILAGNSTDSVLHTFTISSTITGAGGLNTGDNFDISGNASAFANSVGTLILTGNNSFTGGAASSGAASSTLRLGNANAVKNSTVTVSVGTGGGLSFSPSIGTFNLGGLAGANNVVLVDSAAAAVTLNVGGGVNNNSSTYSGVLSGTNGALTKSGLGTLTLTNANNYTGATTVKNGTLTLTSPGAISSTLVLGDSGGTTGILDVTAKSSFSEANVSGKGTMNIGTGKTITVTGALAPGFSIGTIDITGDLALGTSTAMELAGNGGVAGTDSDFVNITGGMNYAGALTVSSFGGYNLAQNASYNLFDFTGSDAGQFASVTVGGTGLSFSSNVWTGSSGGMTYSFNESTGVLNITIPEPGTFGLIGVGVMGLMAGRRRRTV